MGKCKNCGTMNTSDAKFCRNCGKSIYFQSSNHSAHTSINDISFTNANKSPWYSNLLPDGDDIIKLVIIILMIIACIVLLIQGGPMAGLIVPGAVIIYKYWRDD